MKKIRRNLFWIIPGIIIILLAFCIFLIRDRKSNLGELKELQSELEELERKRTAADAIKEEVKQISRYAAYEFSYTSVLGYSDKGRFMGMDIPFTENYFIATIDGKINIGINGDEVKFVENTDPEGKVTGVKIFVPHSEILENYTLPETLQVFDMKNNVFNPVEPEDYNDLLIEAQKQEETKILENDILKRSDETIKYLLTSHFQAVYGENVEIKCMYVDKKK